MKHNLNSENSCKGFLKERFGIAGDQIDIIDQYCSLIKKWSERQNIVSRSDLDSLWPKHIMPSAFLSACIRNVNVKKIADIGSGAGFPGIIIKILQPQISNFLIESSRRKCLFLLEICDSLGINCEVIHKRIENLQQKVDIPFDIIVSRGVAPLLLLWTWSEKIMTERGSLYVLKGGNIDEETEPLRNLNLDFKIIRPDNDWLEINDSLKNKFVVCIRRTHSDR